MKTITWTTLLSSSARHYHLDWPRICLSTNHAEKHALFKPPIRSRILRGRKQLHPWKKISAGMDLKMAVQGSELYTGPRFAQLLAADIFAESELDRFWIRIRLDLDQKLYLSCTANGFRILNQNLRPLASQCRPPDQNLSGFELRNAVVRQCHCKSTTNIKPRTGWNTMLSF